MKIGILTCAYLESTLQTLYKSVVCLFNIAAHSYDMKLQAQPVINVILLLLS